MIIQNNAVYSIGNVSGTHDVLPLGTYRLRHNERTDEFYLNKIEDFKLPKKLYGDFSFCDRILNTFENTEKNLGVLLSGEKGSGKTILAKKVCCQSNKPVIVIDECFTSSELISFLADPSIGECVILIDEFEKLYQCNDDCTIILQLLDGAANSHHLFLLTCNQTKNVSDYLLNRPSRIYYRKEYDSIPDDVVAEIIECELLNKSLKKEFNEVLDKMPVVTYDILMSLLKEVNLYNQSPLECAKMMNFVSERTFVVVEQHFKDGTFLDATYDSYIASDKRQLEVLDLRSGKESGNSNDYTYQYIDMDKFVKLDRQTWEYRQDDNHYIIRKRSNKSLLF
jgi:hypothetical protein